MFFLSLGFADSGGLGNGTFSKCNNPLLHFHPYWLQSAVGSPRALPRGSAVTAATSADQGENVCAFSHGQPVCMKLFCGTFLADGGSENRIFHCLSTVIFQNPVDIETAQTREMCCFYNERFTLFCCVHTYRNPFYAPFLHSSGMSSGTYVHGKSP